MPLKPEGSSLSGFLVDKEKLDQFEFEAIFSEAMGIAPKAEEKPEAQPETQTEA